MLTATYLLTSPGHFAFACNFISAKTASMEPVGKPGPKVSRNKSPAQTSVNLQNQQA